MENSGQVHWEDLKRVLRQLSGSLNDGLNYTKSVQEENILEDFMDEYYACNVDTRKSLSNFVFTLFGATISWIENQ